MKLLILLILALATLLPSLAQAYDVLVLQSRHDRSYDEALKGFRAEWPGSQRVLVISDYSEVDVVRIIREERPRLILTIGDVALKEVRKVRQTPIVALMSLGINAQAATQPNLTGISLFAAPESYLAAFQAIKARRVGLVINSAKNETYLRQARKAAQEMGIELVVAEALSSRDTISHLTTLDGRIDALWMLPDPTVITRNTVESYFRFAQEHSLPLISFAPAYLTMGAAAIVDIDRYETGRQAAIMAGRLLAGEVPPVITAKSTIKGNPSVLQRLKLSPSLLNGLNSAQRN
ncbi:ABC transporter substrate-binding protein [Pelotalea chapellei]|uniref:ABC transporter substrate-binding protein n=1 Tax=Pelotalea chapellei TaxID=44671 RepID=A0ABS5UD86_9BACT|nr:ABC transporter substrate binding protein [Pelotalea chapellei]MBT1073611.1 ABC transporter substrate-binding protein [Pelotalea chapellei]